MAELAPYPFAALIRRLFRELDRTDSIFDLPARKFFLDPGARDLSVDFHGRRAASPLGPAAGPQSQMAQNLVLAWLGGSRVLELKTVQVRDELQIPRPCIDMQTIGFNVEWSQELKLEQSLEEYVKGAMLIEMLQASGRLPVAPGFRDVVYDMSVGYDLDGIRSPTVHRFIRAMLDGSEVVERLRRQIPDEHAELRDLDFRTRLSDTLTLSTFHGCPPDEIERIIEYLFEEHGLHCIVKLNPMLLGPARARELLHDVLGYTDVTIPDSAFERDTHWDQALAFTDRLGERAAALGLGFGVKFTNTLIVANERDFFPADQEEMYLSGPPLHVLAMNLVRRFRAAFGDRYPISFSAGIDRKNFPDAVALGLVPVTVCSDLLKPGGYGRSRGYLDELAARMERVGARDVDEYVLRAYGLGATTLSELDLGQRARAAWDAGGDLRAAAGDAFADWVAATRVANTEHYVEHATHDERYARARNAKVPKKIGSELELFDCITCDKCIPVCPNDANFTFVLPALDLPIVKRAADGTLREEGRIPIREKHQIANFADFCNDCGNCDVFCPEDGGPYVVKPRFFGSRAAWERSRDLDGFVLGADWIRGRFEGREFLLAIADDRLEYSGDGFALVLDADGAPASARGRAAGEVDLTWVRLLASLHRAVLDATRPNYVNCL